MLERALKLRQKIEYEMLMRVPENDLIHIEPAPGETPPCVSRYHVTYYVPTWVQDDDGNVFLQEKTTVQFEKTSLTDSVRISVAEGRTPFHMNWFISGVYGGGAFWSRRETLLYEYIAEILSVLQFRETSMCIHSPSNAAARAFYLQHREDEQPMFPTDTRDLPAMPETERKIQIAQVSRGQTEEMGSEKK